VRALAAGKDPAPSSRALTIGALIREPEAYDETHRRDPGVCDDRPALVQDHAVPGDRGPLGEALSGYENRPPP
jgi:hypothetical protein